jgi:2-polyprenyl-3-methyl-5-hydroxy-6-metoxy-1,4-benzoquinol methylase
MRHEREDHAREVERGERFQFGRNWARFLATLTPERIEEAERSLREMLGVQTLQGKTLLDVGSGSGLFSLAARRLGAKVISFDYDPVSVDCTQRLREHFFAGDGEWTIKSGSILDSGFIAKLPAADIVYSWGVLHHTGSMWQAMDNACRLTAQEGTLFVAIYNDQGAVSDRWLKVKQAYCSGAPGRMIVTGLFVPYFMARSFIGDALRLKNPFRRYVEYQRNRGMSLLTDWIDWLGGLPFEVASPEAVVAFCEKRGFYVDRVRDCGNTHGCNEFVFRKGCSNLRP